MADNGFKINKSVNFNPQAGAPANAIDGDFYYDSVAQTFAYHHNGHWANLDSVGTVTNVEFMTSADFTSDKVRNSVVKVTGGVAVSHLTGISSSFSAKTITVYNNGSDTIVVEPEDAHELTANNRILTPTAGSMNLVAGEVAVFMYDVAATRWLLVSISSNAGAQVIATDVNYGLVKLHKASLVPPPNDGIVLSDGDLNTANGVVGLNAGSQVTIDLTFATTAKKIAWSDWSIDQLGSLDGLRFVSTFADEYAEIFRTLSITQFSLWNNTGYTHIRANDPGGGGTSTILTDAGIGMAPNATLQWTFNVDGSLSSTNQDKITNVANPTATQDVATKNYVDVIHGAYGFQTGTTNISVTTVAARPQSSGTDKGYIGNMVTNGAGGTNWSISTPTGYVYRVQGRLSFYIQGVGGTTANMTLDFTPVSGVLMPANQVVYAEGGAFAAGQRYQVPFSYVLSSAGDEANFTLKCNVSTLTLQEVAWDFYVTRIG